MEIIFRLFFYILISFFIPSISLAVSTTTKSGVSEPIAGYWRTYDLDNIPRSIVKVSIHGNELTIYIVKVIPSQKQGADAVCTQCSGANKNKPLAGLPIIWGAKKNGDKWTGGTILDADSGKTYSCNLSTSADGKILYLHAYIGTPLLGKTVEWQRVSK